MQNFPSIIANLFFLASFCLIGCIYWFFLRNYKNKFTALFYGSFLIVYVATARLLFTTFIIEVGLDPGIIRPPFEIGFLWILWIFPFILFIHSWQNRLRLLYGLVFYFLSFIFLFFFIVSFVLKILTNDPSTFTYSILSVINQIILIFSLFVSMLIMHLGKNNQYITKIRKFLITNQFFILSFFVLTLGLFVFRMVRERELMFSKIIYKQMSKNAINQNLNEYGKRNNISFIRTGDFQYGEFLYQLYSACPQPQVWPTCEAIKIITDEKGSIKLIQGRGPFIMNSFDPIYDYYTWMVHTFSFQTSSLDSK